MENHRHRYFLRSKSTKKQQEINKRVNVNNGSLVPKNVSSQDYVCSKRKTQVVGTLGNKALADEESKTVVDVESKTVVDQDETPILPLQVTRKRLWPEKESRKATNVEEKMMDAFILLVFLVLPPLMWAMATANQVRVATTTAATMAVRLLRPTIVGAAASTLLVTLTFWDSLIPGINPPSPGPARKDHSVGSIYVFNSLFGLATFVYATLIEFS